MSWIALTDLRGGRNGVDNAVDPRFPMNQGVECYNVDFEAHAPLGRKRGGSSQLSLAGGTAPAGSINSLFTHVPSGDETARELWLIDGNVVWKRLAGGTNWATVTASDALTDAAADGCVAITFNGKLFLFYTSAVDRSHVWDGTVHRRNSISTPGVPTVANTGGGAYPAVLRYYRTRFLELSGALVIRRSEPSTSVSFTPSGAGTAARVTRAAAASESETHWEIEASTDNVNFYRLSQIVIGTTTYDDSALVATYVNNTLSDVLGFYTAFYSFRFALTDGNRMILAGAPTDPSGVYYTPVLGSANKGDDERLEITATNSPFIRLNTKDGGAITGLGGPIDGIIYAFKYRQIWRGTPTGVVSAPYTWRCISRIVGSVNHKSIVLGEDGQGRSAVYFLSYQGPYRLGYDGLQYLGRDIEDVWRGFGSFTTGVNLAANGIIGHGVYHADKQRVEWCLSTGASNTPVVRLVLYVRQANRVDEFGVRGGWVYHTLDVAARQSVMFSNTVGATMSRDLKPYLARSDATVVKTDIDATLNDSGTSFQAYVKTRSIVPAEQLGRNFAVRESILIAQPLAGLTLTQTLDRDYGLELQTSTVLLTAEATENHVIRKFDGSSNSDMGVVQVQIGDAAAQDGQWHLDALLIPVEAERQK